MSKQPTISLCIIARDEAETIEHCLNSAKPFVDEMILTDTGSKDKTAAIARMCGAKVVQIPWEQNFAKARNASIEYAAGDWILILDAEHSEEALILYFRIKWSRQWNTHLSKSLF